MAGAHYLSDSEAAKKAEDYLSAEIWTGVERGPVSFKLVVQLAALEDRHDDPSMAWPDNRQIVELGTIAITKVLQNNDAVQHELLFLPDALPSGIESQDPMINARSAAYPVSYARRQK